MDKSLKKEHIEAFYPILNWSDADVVDFIRERGIKLHPLYYREDGTIDAKRRLGCICCPLKSTNKRIADFLAHPNMVKAYIKAGKLFRDCHPTAKTTKKYSDVYAWFYRYVFCRSQEQFEECSTGLWGKVDYKDYLERKFNIKL